MFESVAPDPPATRRSRRFIVAGFAGTALLVAAAALATTFADDFVERRLRTATVNLLRERLQSEVELGPIDVRFTPVMSVRFEGLTLRHQGRTDIPPLVALRSLTLESSVLDLWNRQVERVHIDGLEISIPPGRGRDMPDVSRAGDTASPAATAARDTPTPNVSAGEPDKRGIRDIRVRELLSENARLTIMPKQEGKNPREFGLHKLRFENFQFAEPTPFEAALSNPTPRGEIRTTGSFGPWQGDEPSATPIAGTFTFDADLGTIKGIAGSMTSEGSYGGRLERIETTGRTTTPEFRITALKGQPLPLTTTYNALVDGTNGDVVLSRIEATLGESVFLVNGAVVGLPGVRGRNITLKVLSDHATLEDVLRLSLSSETPVMTGGIGVDATVEIPPGDVDVIDKIVLDGSFAIDDARFTSDEVQDKIDELSRRGQGRPKDERIEDVVSDFRGRFHLEDRLMQLQNLTFTVRGAKVAMGGQYHLGSEALDFRGSVNLDARASQTMTGFRSWIMKPFDGLLRKRGAGTRLAIKVTGSREKPEFGVEIGRTLKGK